ncbi:MAG: PEGA domain-containing protein [Deltaproteobacteria bacterium]|nr:PEGA domain-containing protein [Deltaproteobacteria bacterium]
MPLQKRTLLARAILVTLLASGARAATPAPTTTTTTTTTTTPPVAERSDVVVPAATSTHIMVPAAGTSAEPAAIAGVRPRLAVVGFVSNGVPSDIVAAVESTTATEVSRLVKADVISAEDLRMLMNVSAYQSTMGCDSDDCLRSLGDALSVQQVVSGSIQKSGARYVLTLVRLDTVNSRVLQRTTVDVGEASELVRAARRVAPALFGVVAKLVVWGQPEAADVLLDGQRIGSTPMASIDVKTPGAHVLEIVGPTVTPWKHEFEIGAGDELKVRAHNRLIAEVEQEAAVWTWTGSGLVAGGAVAVTSAGFLYFLASRNDQRVDAVIRTASRAELDEITDLTLSYVIGAVGLGVVGLAGLGGGAAALALNPARAELDAALGE